MEYKSGRATTQPHPQPRPQPNRQRDNRLALEIGRSILQSNPALRKQLDRQQVDPSQFENKRIPTVVITPKERISVEPRVKKKLTKEEKKVLHKQVAGSAKLFTKEGVKESLSIANREDWED
ncbi:hypothetical protein [Rossellomorea vietnamensis]|uniref:hypothetical protein n=1 Tax=Rossellomorea vietnamensis TaxID=218284 RepID=UPI000AD3369A|nr:hypothetical protein [Rossellomorea vietnamensis]